MNHHHTFTFGPATRIAVVVLLSMLAGADRAPRVSAASSVTVTGVASNHSSVRVYYAPVAGARDYRVFDVNNPDDVKYAGLVRLLASPDCPGDGCAHHFVLGPDRATPVFPYRVASGGSGGPQVLDVPATQIEWNGAGDGLPHTLVVEAVDALGPVPQASLYAGPNNAPLVTGHSHESMLGSNKGPTSDGKISTNGQGPYSNRPTVLARSAPFVVQANTSYKAVPSSAAATQAFFDTFDDAQQATMKLVSRDDRGTDEYGNYGIMKYTLNGGTNKAWEIDYRQADNAHSMPFIASNHFMDMLFDGATPGTNAPSHTAYASMSMSPLATFDIAAGKIAHITMEVDGHQSGRRWMAIQIARAADPLKAWNPGEQRINDRNEAFFLEIRDASCTLDIFAAPASSSKRPSGSVGGAHGSRLWGSAGQAEVMCMGGQMYVPANRTSNGLGLDDRSRYDLFLSQTHAALFQDGHLIVESDIPAGSLGWATGPLRAYYTHYVYHTANEVNDLMRGRHTCHPMNAFWFNDPREGTPADRTPCKTAYPPGYGFPHSDERHWDNMGFEVLPASAAQANNFSRLASLVQLPPVRAPQAGGAARQTAATGTRTLP
jgi:hypothetical protein